ncbi:ABC transporter permease [Nitrospirillum sp. BR 11163]|uniref:ABC transporter permease n=1 Tax=Nitrospirillum sp. BR 11163 TaxID=3104323 RepID=UPI002AFECA8B|nr:ABC transporter permease subunit [Nitrospirillum sp. BR 11163]MEA1673638.1 ABC transporter permease subunit [Nitrospirillum sp. BR 11163]
MSLTLDAPQDAALSAVSRPAPRPVGAPLIRWVLTRLGNSRWTVPLALVLAWELGSRVGLVPSRVLAAPSAVLATFWTLLASGELVSNLLVSLVRVATGLGIGVGVGTVLAVLAGLFRRGETLVDPLMQMLRTLPFLALVPLFIVWFGIGEVPKVALIALGAAFPTYLTLFSGIRAIEAKLVEAGRSFGLSRLELITNVVLPGAAPSFLVGLRYALGHAWLSLVVAEQINASAGLGYLINNARDFMRTDIIVVCLGVYAVLGLGTDFLVRLLERRLLAWRPTFLER